MIGGYFSSPLNISCDAPHGSVLGQLLFTVYSDSFYTLKYFLMR